MSRSDRHLPYSPRRTWGLSLAIATAWAGAAGATDINWSSAVGTASQTSAGVSAPLGAGFVFELGAFADGFVPGPQNTGDWGAHWVALDRAAYNPESRFFASKATLASNALPFHFTRKAFIWGFNRDTPGEWILLTNAAWLWPYAEGGVQPPVTWSIGAPGTTAVVGAVNGAGFQVRTASIPGSPPPDVRPGAWIQQHFTLLERSNPGLAGWEADPDHDGAGNLLELAVGSDPRASGGPPVPIVERVPAGGAGMLLQVRLPRAHRAAIRYGAEASPDLLDWSASGVTVTADTPEAIVFRAPPGSGNRIFMRLTFAE